MPSYGLIVEGPYDEAVYPILVRRLTSPNTDLIVRPCGGVSKLKRAFPSYLQEFLYAVQGNPVEKALVIRDSGGKESAALERQMAERIRNRHYPFPKGIQFCAVQRAMETWLLADANAINAVALTRHGRPITEVRETLEDIADPKDRLKRLLSQAKLDYDPEVCREIAAEVRIETLRYRCRSFRSFELKVHDC